MAHIFKVLLNLKIGEIEKLNNVLESTQKNIEFMEQEIVRHFRKWREVQGISLRSMAQRLDITPSYLSDIELGRRGISKAILIKLKKL